MDVQFDVDDGVATALRAQLGRDRGQPVIRVPRTGELQEALSTLAALGVRKLGYRFRFYDDGDVTWEFTARRRAARDRSALPAIKDARHQLGQLLEDAVREATTEFMGVDRELSFECEVTFSPNTGSWKLSGRGTTYEVTSDLSAIEIALD